MNTEAKLIAENMKKTRLFEKAWSRYIAALNLFDERRENGQRTQMARRGIRCARRDLNEVCAQIGVEAPACV